LISFVFIGSEIAAGIISNSIAIISDAIHLITDLVGFVFSFLFLYLSKKEPTSKMTFGYHRMELLGALSNLFIIYVLLLFVVFEASERIIAR
jgi:cation diffusion facilitator family transporter